MFPTHVGMNRAIRVIAGKPTHVPHTRGDEPNGMGVSRTIAENVPHTRGDEPPAPRPK